MKKTIIAFAMTAACAAATAGLPTTDQDFVTEAGQGGLAEVALGKLASEHGSSAAVKKFGMQMVADHGKANADLKRAASEAKAKVPGSPSEKQQQTLAKLKALKGAEFDKAYADEMVDDHKTDVASFEKEAASAEDTPIRAFASTTLPTLKHHLQMAEDLQKENR